MRKALLEARRFVWTSAQRTDRDLLVISDEKRGPYVLSPKETLVKIDAALSAPARQCDVGTADEQCERYKATGETYHTLTLANALAWAQTPYVEEGGAK
jgi:hypothetical protein